MARSALRSSSAATLLIALAVVCLTQMVAHGGETAMIAVPNASFESPKTLYASPNLDAWQKAPKPDSYVEGGGILWSQLVGVFTNVAPAGGVPIDNCDGNQAIWLFAVPEVSLSQDYFSLDYNDSVPSLAFDATYEAGKSYTLTIGVIGGIPPMAEGVTLEISLYAVDAASNRTAVAAISITNSPNVFSNVAHLLDFQVQVPVVKNNDPWKGQHIGIQMLSTVSTNLQGGYWDLDNVRLTSTVETTPAEPVIDNPKLVNGQFQFRLQSEPGLRFEILMATNPVQPMLEWSVTGLLTNGTGSSIFTDPVTNLERRFYRVRQLP